MFIYPYNQESESVKRLKEALNAKIIKLENSKFKGSETKTVINWGNSMTNEEIEKCFLLNKPEAVALASNKLKFFSTVAGHVPIPDWTVSVEEAAAWLDAGHTVLGRLTLTGHSGKGIVIFDTAEHLYLTIKEGSRFPLFTKYVPKRNEYRIHVFRDKIVDVQEKRLSSKTKDSVNYKIRNHGNGFIYARENVSLPNGVAENCIRAVELCGLDFGAVDVIWNEYRKTGFLLEINTAPGLEGQTINKYADVLVSATNNVALNIARSNLHNFVFIPHRNAEQVLIPDEPLPIIVHNP